MRSVYPTYLASLVVSMDQDDGILVRGDANGRNLLDVHLRRGHSGLLRARGVNPIQTDAQVKSLLAGQRLGPHLQDELRELPVLNRHVLEVHAVDEPVADNLVGRHLVLKLLLLLRHSGMGDERHGDEVCLFSLSFFFLYEDFKEAKL
mgnify:CR=1 FL=1